MQLVQIHRPPWGDNDWDTLDLSEQLLYMIINLEADGQVQLPDVDGLPTFIINKEWRTYSMYRLRDGNRKRGVRIVDLSDPSPIVSVPSVALDAGIPFSFSPGQNLNPPQVSAPPERPRVPTETRARARRARGARNDGRAAPSAPLAF